MIVRIRFGRGPRLSRRSGKNARLALAAATLGTLGAVSCAMLGVWRLGQDLGWAGDFAFNAGILSHWQVWLSAAAAIQFVCWKLARYGRRTQETRSPETEKTDSSGRVRVTANT